MKTLRTLKISPNAPDINSVWLYKGIMKYFNNGEWESIGGVTSVDWEDITNKPDFASLYAPLDSQLTLGETVSTAYRGDRGKIAYEHTLLNNNPHSVTKSQIGLSNVDNTSDDDKPLSTLQQAALTDLHTVLNDSITTHVSDQTNPHKTKLSLGIKFSVTGASVVIPTNSTYNLMQLLNLTDKVVFTGNVGISEYSLVNAGTANALLKLPNIDGFVDYTISVRLTGTVGTGEDPREFYIDLRRADNTVVEGRAILKLNSSALDRRGISFESASLNSNDNFITSGIKLVINNPTTGSASITLTGVEILIKGSY